MKSSIVVLECKNQHSADEKWDDGDPICSLPAAGRIRDCFSEYEASGHTALKFVTCRTDFRLPPLLGQIGHRPEVW
jgi:hypothetical protein